MKPLLIVFCLIILLPLSSSAQNKTLPNRITMFLTDHFPEYHISSYKHDNDDNEYKIELESGHELKMHADGQWIDIEGEYTPLPKSIIDLLPANICGYISKKYPRKTIVRIKQKDYGYKIELATSINLEFNKDGTFIKRD